MLYDYFFQSTPAPVETGTDYLPPHHLQELMTEFERLPLQKPKEFIAWIKERFVLNEKFETLIDELRTVPIIYYATASYKPSQETGQREDEVHCILYWEIQNSEDLEKRQIIIKDKRTSLIDCN